MTVSNDWAVDVAKEILADVGAHAVRVDSLQREVLVRQVNARTQAGLLASDVAGLEADEVPCRIGIVTALAKMDAAHFGESAAAHVGDSSLGATLAALAAEDRVRALLTEHALAWDDLRSMVLGAPCGSGGSALAEGEQVARAHLVPVGLAAVRRDTRLASQVADRLRERTGADLSADEVLHGGAGELLRLVGERAPMADAGAGADDAPVRAPSSDGETAEPATVDAVEVQWPMSPQAVLRVFFHEAPGVVPPSVPGELLALRDGYRLVRGSRNGEGSAGLFKALDPSDTRKSLSCGDLVRVVST